MHTCIRRLTEQRGLTFDPAEVRKKTDPITDENWFRKVSKYDMDSLNVDWDELNKEKQRQVTYNGKKRQEVSG